jgi:hypothetical protein
MCRAREERAKNLGSGYAREKSTVLVSDPHTPELNAKASESAVTSALTHKKLHFRSYIKELATSSQSQSPPLTEAESIILDHEISYFINCECILDTDVTLEEIGGALKTLKLGKSGGIDSLEPEHIHYGGGTLRLWLKKFSNRIVSLEEVPTSLNEGLIIPVHKGKGKDPFQPGNYRGIALSSVILLRRLSPLLEEAGVPDFSQTAYQKGLSCADATQETLLTHVMEANISCVYYDIDKAFDSAEIPILLKRLYSIGINGKLWRLLKHWYSTSSAVSK